MVPHIYIHEQLMFKRVREWQRKAKQEQMLAGLWKPHHGIVRYLIECLGIFFVAPRTSMRHLEQPDQRAVCNCMRDSMPYRKDTMMNPQIHAEEQLNTATHLQTVVLERERLDTILTSPFTLAQQKETFDELAI